MPELIAPTVRLHTAWLEAHAEWGPGQHEDGFGLGPSDEVDSAEGFAAWVRRLTDESDPVKAADAMRRRYRWIVESDRVLGGIALRHGSSDYVQWAGNIGYGIRPSARRRGLASWAVGRMLDEARTLGLDRVLAVCAVDNAASVKTIERCGGIFEGIRDTEFGPARRYWITPYAGSAGYATDSPSPARSSCPTVISCSDAPDTDHPAPDTRRIQPNAESGLGRPGMRVGQVDLAAHPERTGARRRRYRDDRRHGRTVESRNRGGLPMRSVTYSMGVSLDGYIVGPDGGFNWTEPDEEIFGFVTDELRGIGVHCMGRRLYETMLYWETADQDPSLDESMLEWAALWKPLPKVVFSTTLSAVQGNARLASGDLAAEIERLRAEPGEGDIAIGGATLAAEAAASGLIDEYRPKVYPVLVGGGIPFFPQHERRVDLELVETRTFSSQVVYLRYRVRR